MDSRGCYTPTGPAGVGSVTATVPTNQRRSVSRVCVQPFYFVGRKSPRSRFVWIRPAVWVADELVDCGRGIGNRRTVHQRFVVLIYGHLDYLQS